MILFFRGNESVFAVQAVDQLKAENTRKLSWLLGNADLLDTLDVPGRFVGPRKEMITPWSTNAVEICQNMGLNSILRIEEFVNNDLRLKNYDRMLEQIYEGLDQQVFYLDHKPEPVLLIEDIVSYNLSQGLALSGEEIIYLEKLQARLGRKLTDSEVFGFSQVNSEHCRHKIFNGIFVINGKEMPDSLFALIRKTSAVHSRLLVSAYKDNVAFIEGPLIEQFAPVTQDKPDFFFLKDILSVISLKAETHNFPTTVEPFNGAATGSGGEIRDRMAGGKGSIPLAGTAVYMTSYPRIDGGRSWKHRSGQENGCTRIRRRSLSKHQMGPAILAINSVNHLSVVLY